MKNVVIICGVIFLIAGGGYWGWEYWKKNMGTEEQSLSELPTGSVERISIQSVVEVSGDIEPIEQVEVKAEISARIKKIHVELGQVVKAGQLLVELDNKQLLTELASAEIEIEGAQLEVEKADLDFDRDKRLYAKKLIPEKDYLNSEISKKIAENRLQKSQKRLQTVKDKLDKTKVGAPMSGKILELPVIEGQVVVAAASVNSGTMIMKLADLSQLLIKTHVNQIDVSKLSKGMKVGFSVDSVPGKEMEGEIVEISPTATVRRNIKGFTVEIVIENPNANLKPGMTADVKALVGVAENVLAVPLSSVFSGKEGSKVAFVKKELEANALETEERVVEVGVSNLDYVEIKSGLKEGEIVFLTRPNRESSLN